MVTLLFLNFEITQFNQAQFRSKAVFRPKWRSWTETGSPTETSSYLIAEKLI